MLGSDIVSLESRCLYRPSPHSTSCVGLLVNRLSGTLIDGTEFDSSYKRGQPTTFAPNQVIKVCNSQFLLTKLSLANFWLE